MCRKYRNVCNQKRTNAANLHWEYIDNPIPGNNAEEKIQYFEKLLHQRRSKSIRCIELDKIFDSGIDAQNATGISRSGISMCCKGKRQTAGGYHWEYYQGEENE